MTVSFDDLKTTGTGIRNGKTYIEYRGVIYGEGTLEEALANATYKVNGVDVPQFHDNGMFENKILAIGCAYCNTKTFDITLKNENNTWGDGIVGR